MTFIDDLGRFAIAALLVCGASTDAAAWQRPKVQPAEKVATCPELGDGFIRIPGSDSCVRLNGSVRVEALHVGAGSAYSPGR